MLKYDIGGIGMRQRTVSLYGWDLDAEWHGPDEIEVRAARKLARKLRLRTGWYSGPLHCDESTALSLHMMVRDVGDAAVATVDFADAAGAPAQVLAIIPGERRTLVRSDFAFSFTSYLSLLKVLPEGAELPVHDGMERAIREQERRATLVFAITGATMPCEYAIAMAEAAECAVGSILDWMEAPGAARSLGVAPVVAHADVHH